jgi:hypothetical protein
MAATLHASSVLSPPMMRSRRATKYRTNTGIHRQCPQQQPLDMQGILCCQSAKLYARLRAPTVCPSTTGSGAQPVRFQTVTIHWATLYLSRPWVQSTEPLLHANVQEHTGDRHTEALSTWRLSVPVQRPSSVLHGRVCRYLAGQLSQLCHHCLDQYMCVEAPATGIWASYACLQLSGSQSCVTITTWTNTAGRPHV